MMSTQPYIRTQITCIAHLCKCMPIDMIGVHLRARVDHMEPAQMELQHLSLDLGWICGLLDLTAGYFASTVDGVQTAQLPPLIT